MHAHHPTSNQQSSTYCLPYFTYYVLSYIPYFRRTLNLQEARRHASDNHQPLRWQLEHSTAADNFHPMTHKQLYPSKHISPQWWPNTANEKSHCSPSPPSSSTILPTSKIPSCVLDTLLDFSAGVLREDGRVANSLKRPYMNEFLTWNVQVLRFGGLGELYCVVGIWIPWIRSSFSLLLKHIINVFLGRVKPLGGGSEIKLTELGMISNPGYKICFVLDKTSMFKIVSSTKGREKGWSIRSNPCKLYGPNFLGGDVTIRCIWTIWRGTLLWIWGAGWSALRIIERRRRGGRRRMGGERMMRSFWDWDGSWNCWRRSCE